jgi:hypothetical protein
LEEQLAAVQQELAPLLSAERTAANEALQQQQDALRAVVESHTAAVNEAREQQRAAILAEQAETEAELESRLTAVARATAEVCYSLPTHRVL